MKTFRQSNPFYLHIFHQLCVLLGPLRVHLGLRVLVLRRALRCLQLRGLRGHCVGVRGAQNIHGKFLNSEEKKRRKSYMALIY